MRNLAGVPDAGAYIVLELIGAGVLPVLHDGMVQHSEVPTRVTGALGPFTFERLWYYYAARGSVPLAVARELYDHPIGRRYVRVDGYAGNREPSGRIDVYHIDSQDGLNLFVETLRRHGLAGGA